MLKFHQIIPLAINQKGQILSRLTKSILALSFVFIFSGSLSAQKFSYVDTDYILEQMPDYRSAQKQLDDVAEKAKAELLKKKEEIDKLKTSYEAENLLMPEDIRKKKEDEILLKTKEYDQFKKDKFGADGELFKKRQELVKPIQDKVFDAVQKVAKENIQDFIFDKAGAVTILYSNPKYDRSDEVLELLNAAANTKSGKKDSQNIKDPINKLLKDEDKTKPGQNLYQNGQPNQSNPNQNTNPNIQPGGAPGGMPPQNPGMPPQMPGQPK